MHPTYRASGWSGVLPLAAGTKWPPPSGFTGWDGIYPSYADCDAWAGLEYAGTPQTALRMPPTVIGLDVDHYDAKRGGDTMVEAARRWGRLPVGPWSSARVDGMSGIGFFRVPDGTVLVSNLAFPDLMLGDVEVIQRHHRYAVVWPSVHPRTDTRYTWRSTAGPDVPPQVDELPELPQSWLDGLAGTGREGERAQPEQVAAFLASIPAGTACARVREVLRDADAALQSPVECRHDDTCKAVLRLLRIGEQRHPGVPAALAALETVFIRTVTADGSRTTASAAAEFDRMRHGENGIGRILASQTPPERRRCRCSDDQSPASREAIAGVLRTVLNADAADQIRLLRWGTDKLRRWAVTGRIDPVFAERLVDQLITTVGGAR